MLITGRCSGPLADGARQRDVEALPVPSTIDSPSSTGLVDWPAPGNVVGAIIDIGARPGHRTAVSSADQAAAAIGAVDRLIRFRSATAATFPIVLSGHGPADGTYGLARVLAAEVAGGPLPLYDTSRADARALIDRLLDADAHQPAGALGTTMIHPVRFTREERGEHLLGEFLLSGARATVWELLRAGFDPVTAALAAGFRSHHKFWEPLYGLISAVIHLRDQGVQLDELGGRVIRLGDVEREIGFKVISDVDIALYAVRSASDLHRVAQQQNIATLMKIRRAYADWLTGAGKRPSQSRSTDQGEFTNSYRHLLGHPEIADIFR